MSRPLAERLESRAYLSASAGPAAHLSATRATVAGLSFAAPVNISTVAGVVAAASGDLNGDGNTDLALLSVGGSGSGGTDGATPAAPTGDAIVSVLLGRGDGTFQPAVNTLVNLSNLTTLSGAGGPVFLGQPAIGDFNGDGRQDLALAVQGNLRGASGTTFASGGAVLVLPGNGDGTFGSPSVVSNTPGIAVSTANSLGESFSTAGGAFFTTAGAGVVTIGSTNGIVFVPSGTASGFVVASQGAGNLGSGSTGLGSFGSGNVFGGPVDNGGSSFGDANGAFVATGLPTAAGGTALGVSLGSAATPVLTGATGGALNSAAGTPTGNEFAVGVLPTFTQSTFPSSLGDLPTFNTSNTTGINTFNQINQPVDMPLASDGGAVALATQNASGAAGPVVSTGAVASTSGGTLVVLRPVNFGAAGTLAGVPGFTSFPGGLPVGFSATGPFVVAGDFNGDSQPDLAVLDPAADTVAILLNTTAAGTAAKASPKSAAKSAALNALVRSTAADTASAGLVPTITAAPSSLKPGGVNATVTLKVANEGAAFSSSPVTLELFAAVDQIGSAGQTPILKLTRKLSLKVKQSKSIKLKLGKLPGLAAGSYTLVATTTAPDGSVAVATCPQTITVSPK